MNCAVELLHLMCARFVKLSNHAVRGVDISLWLGRGRKMLRKISLRNSTTRRRRRAAVESGDLGQRAGCPAPAQKGVLAAIALPTSCVRRSVAESENDPGVWVHAHGVEDAVSGMDVAF